MNRVLDTNVILYLLEGELTETLPSGYYFVSVITEMELLSYPSLTRTEELSIHSFLSDTQIIELTSDVKNNAIRLRRQYGLKLPDAIIAATALSLEAELLTNDREILKISELRCRKVFVRIP